MQWLRRFPGSVRLVGVVLGSFVVASACSDSDPSGPGGGDDDPVLTVDAADDWAFVRLGEVAEEVSVSDPGTSSDWDIAFHATSVMLNGGGAGPGDVEGYCLCQNQSASDGDVEGMTPESELAAFVAAGLDRLPDEDAWQSDALARAISGWFEYDMETHQVSLADKVWKVRAADGTGFAKLRVAGMEGASQADAGMLTLEYAYQEAAGEPLGEVQTVTVDLSSGGQAYLDLASGDVSDAAGASEWDLFLEGYTIRVNGGVSGSGEAGAVGVEDAFGDVTDPGDMTENHYSGDAYGGVFEEARWYRYNLQGQHQIWPTFDVYLIRRGSDVYKVQLTGYYGATGDSRQITFRYSVVGG